MDNDTYFDLKVYSDVHSSATKQSRNESVGSRKPLKMLRGKFRPLILQINLFNRFYFISSRPVTLSKSKAMNSTSEFTTWATSSARLWLELLWNKSLTGKSSGLNSVRLFLFNHHHSTYNFVPFDEFNFIQSVIVYLCQCFLCWPSVSLWVQFLSKNLLRCQCNFSVRISCCISRQCNFLVRISFGYLYQWCCVCCFSDNK
jgi:hypothetical protein